MEKRDCLCIDLKSFYASVECVERGLDPMTTNLVVADPERSDKTICLAVSPSMKAMGVPGRCRVFEIPKHIEYIMAPPRMKKYIEYAAEIYGIYLRYLSPEDIHVYSIDEAFLDVTAYRKTYGLTPRELAVKLMEEVRKELGVRAACGIGTNLYLAKIALDITAKHSPDFIGELDEESYRATLWRHRPMTDFWRIGKGTARHLERMGIYNMEQLAHADEDALYHAFGIDAELLIDHAWGRESATIADIKAFSPKNSSLSSGQVLTRDYSFAEGRVIVREMADRMSLDLVEKGLRTDCVSVTVGYSNALHEEPVGATASLGCVTSADSVIVPAAVKLYERIVDPQKSVRRMWIACGNLQSDGEIRQLSLFDGDESDDLNRNKRRQQAILDIQKKFGKNAVLKGVSLLEEATARERNRQIGGHKSGE